ncbi:bifunctional histidinol-phosphatase/imidazoleglycerol-phosphate dehydratase HisB [Xanthomonas hortorum pv. vitians]|uniref:Histidine biosynthesis bifunctional protein HisB n=1 Tax=Xanthomonas hortorum pv. vitians TaxID=83224 RepID=A0A6V7EB47_9XANT|nr:bifunctional histidinol-phosphatase/imidazoleglycerol-phosphate dehydratase HisB [Xanthomonas hortorum]APP85050.1 bifunctional imidazole glycerol-phosphate dehydratase/histidinol phosphatase [Xanthomonas hortorum pv. gardneri]ASW44996.1 bifunctional imidazole glycerol-phosphate dehydratase/histidinol phosphatase [Xanthomonas hortorum]MCC8495273.1 bifunctional histidinol-phosphatase/imidazoleglycerol-phosphate dehydratase HisB [Xanthomonas hortorum pv. gardneri]MCE4282384.1 bifunctional histi
MTPILFVDRDGTLITEPADYQIDAYEKLRFVDNVIPAMLKLRDAGYQFVIVSNQDGLGSESYPRASFDGPNNLMLQIFASQGIVFREVLIDCSWPADNAPTRKPGVGLMVPYLQDRNIDWARSAMVGDRITDIQFAQNLNIRGFQLRTDEFGGEWDWPGIAHELADAPRRAVVQRNTKETRIRVELDLDRVAEPHTATGLPFFDHMLEQIGKHGGFALDIHAEGDLHIDEHHTIEDTGLALGQALREALGDKRGIGRYGFDPESSPWRVAGDTAQHGFTLPMDETIASAALDFSGRPYFVFEGDFKRERVGDLPTELVPHFFRSICDASGLNLHLSVRGENDHHKVEACFKALARALRQAIRREGTALPSTKGAL